MTDAMRTSSILTSALGGAYSRVLLCGLIAAALFAYWLFFGPGYRAMQPSVYELTTSLLLAHPATASDAALAIESDGYLSIVAQHRLLDRFGNE
ncbi:hypothetical protein [Pseudomonas aeruginosa]|uniref:hypothetical protein n=1 Tax=Pseudomonas aeruginosa TaxID=287 RepID=UPI000EB5E1D9|nr:hypothetical protein [Pseudomonas aeruginosa]